MGQAHVRALSAIPNARLVAVCDWQEELASTTAQPLGAVAYTDGAKMIAEADIEALYLCVTPHTHEDLEVRAAERGLHLYAEKPVNLYLDRALRARDAIRSSGIITQVGYQLRYFPNYRQLYDTLAGQEIGTANVCRWGGAPGKDWWRRYDQSGGQLVEMTTHQVDLLRWVMGEVEAVSASYSFDRLFKGESGLTVPDSQTVLLRFRSGASATVSTSCAVGKAWLGAMDFVLRNATVGFHKDTVTVAPEGSLPIPAQRTEMLTADEAFVRAVATGDRSILLSPYEDGLKTAAVTLAANRSAEEGGRLVRLEELLPDA
jgi:predicted dehydrogenase